MPSLDWLVSRPIAHRGYHDLKKGNAENSLGAFKAAISAGFAIECDLQVSKTSEPVVFHDPVLGRMTGIQGNVRDQPPDELRQMALLDTRDGIHTLRKHLDLVAGQVPLVLELKGIAGQDAGIVEGVASALQDYSGPVSVMSFDHWICEQFARLMPQIPRGLTAEGDDTKYDSHTTAMKQFDLHFVSYGINDLPNRFVAETRAKGLPVITWTVRTPEQIDLSLKHADQMTFEGFDPRTIVRSGD